MAVGVEGAAVGIEVAVGAEEVAVRVEAAVRVEVALSLAPMEMGAGVGK